MTKQEAVDSLTAVTQHVLIQNKAEFTRSMNQYLASTGFLGSVLKVFSQIFVSNYFWTFVLNTVVPFIIKLALFVVIQIFAPYLTVLEPFLDKLIDIIDESLLSLQQKENAKAVIAMMTSNAPLVQASPMVNVDISPSEKAMLLSQNKYLENYSGDNSNPLFVRGNQ